MPEVRAARHLAGPYSPHHPPFPTTRNCPTNRPFSARPTPRFTALTASPTPMLVTSPATRTPWPENSLRNDICPHLGTISMKKLAAAIAVSSGPDVPRTGATVGPSSGTVVLDPAGSRADTQGTRLLPWSRIRGAHASVRVRMVRRATAQPQAALDRLLLKLYPVVQTIVICGRTAGGSACRPQTPRDRRHSRLTDARSAQAARQSSVNRRHLLSKFLGDSICLVDLLQGLEDGLRN